MQRDQTRKPITPARQTDDRHERPNANIIVFAFVVVVAPSCDGICLGFVVSADGGKGACNVLTMG